SPDALARLEAHDWPGNVRELQSVLKDALVRAAGEVLTAESLPEGLGCGGPLPARAPCAPPGLTLDVAGFVGALLQAGEMDIYRKVASETDRVVLELVLRHAKGNQLVASELLGISRNTLRSKLRSLGLAVEKQLLSE